MRSSLYHRTDAVPGIRLIETSPPPVLALMGGLSLDILHDSLRRRRNLLQYTDILRYAAYMCMVSFLFHFLFEYDEAANILHYGHLLFEYVA